MREHVTDDRRTDRDAQQQRCPLMPSGEGARPVPGRGGSIPTGGPVVRALRWRRLLERRSRSRIPPKLNWQSARLLTGGVQVRILPVELLSL